MSKGLHKRRTHVRGTRDDGNEMSAADAGCPDRDTVFAAGKSSSRP